MPGHACNNNVISKRSTNLRNEAGVLVQKQARRRRLNSKILCALSRVILGRCVWLFQRTVQPCQYGVRGHSPCCDPHCELRARVCAPPNLPNHEVSNLTTTRYLTETLLCCCRPHCRSSCRFLCAKTSHYLVTICRTQKSCRVLSLTATGKLSSTKTTTVPGQTRTRMPLSCSSARFRTTWRRNSFAARERRCGAFFYSSAAGAAVVRLQSTYNVNAFKS